MFESPLYTGNICTNALLFYEELRFYSWIFISSCSTLQWQKWNFVLSKLNWTCLKFWNLHLWNKINSVTEFCNSREILSYCLVVQRMDIVYISVFVSIEFMSCIESVYFWRLRSEAHCNGGFQILRPFMTMEFEFLTNDLQVCTLQSIGLSKLWAANIRSSLLKTILT